MLSTWCQTFEVFPFLFLHNNVATHEAVSVRRCFPAWHETAAPQSSDIKLYQHLFNFDHEAHFTTSTLQLSNLSNIPSFVCSDIANQNKSFRMAAHFENRGKAVHRFLHFLKIVELQRSRTQTRKHSQRDSEQQQQLPADELLSLHTKYLTTAHELTRKPHKIRTKTDRSFILKVRVALLWYINTQTFKKMAPILPRWSSSVTGCC